MNKAQRRILTAWSVVAVLLVCFPHFVHVRQGGRLDAGFGFILTGPFDRTWFRAVIDTPLLIIMELVAAGVAGAAFFVKKGHRPE